MLQRYDISLNSQANRLSIEEFVASANKSRRQVFFEPSKERYSLTHKVIYNGDTILAAIAKGKEALIAELRTDIFFPTRSCVELIADRVIELSENPTNSLSELFVDDKSFLPQPDDE